MKNEWLFISKDSAFLVRKFAYSSMMKFMMKSEYTSTLGKYADIFIYYRPNKQVNFFVGSHFLEYQYFLPIFFCLLQYFFSTAKI